MRTEFDFFFSPPFFPFSSFASPRCDASASPPFALRARDVRQGCTEALMAVSRSLKVVRQGGTRSGPVFSFSSLLPFLFFSSLPSQADGDQCSMASDQGEGAPVSPTIGQAADQVSEQMQGLLLPSFPSFSFSPFFTFAAPGLFPRRVPVGLPDSLRRTTRHAEKSKMRAMPFFFLPPFPPLFRLLPYVGSYNTVLGLA